jgi:hypothetical protein
LRLSSYALALALTVQLGSCYRAEIDLSALADPSGGGSAAPLGGGASDVSGEGGAGAMSGAPSECHDAPFDTVQATCQLAGPPALCSEQDPNGWRGCYLGGCYVCSVDGKVPDYPYYFAWHPCCKPNDTCSNHDFFYCDPRCPPPTEHDRVAPCGENDPNPG